MNREPSENARLAAAVVEAAICSGVGEWVICAGARNLPLVETLMAMPENRRGRVWNFFEERSASFFALGRSKNRATRVAVITTSGTAAAELLPASIEAHYSGQPLLLITADRPPAFRGSGAPQAIEQLDLLMPYVRRVVDWHSAKDRPQSRGRDDSAGPEHWNVCFSEPSPNDAVENVPVSVGDSQWKTERAGELRGVTPDLLCEVAEFCKPRGETDDLLVLLGELSPDERSVVEPALAKLGAPIWAEATSGLRESGLLRSLIISEGERSVADRRPGRVLRIGGVPSLRFWRDLENLQEVEVMSVTHTGFPGLGRESRTIFGIGAVSDCTYGHGEVTSKQQMSASTGKLDELVTDLPRQ